MAMMHESRSFQSVPTVVQTSQTMFREEDEAFHNDAQSSAALSSRALKALEYGLCRRENRNHFRIPIEHSKGEGAIDDAQYRRCRRSFVDCEGLKQVG